MKKPHDQNRTWGQQLGKGSPLGTTPDWDQRKVKWCVTSEIWGLSGGKTGPQPWAQPYPGHTLTFTPLFHDLALETSFLPSLSKILSFFKAWPKCQLLQENFTDSISTPSLLPATICHSSFSTLPYRSFMALYHTAMHPLKSASPTALSSSEQGVHLPHFYVLSSQPIPHVSRMKGIGEWEKTQVWATLIHP